MARLSDTVKHAIPIGSFVEVSSPDRVTESYHGIRGWVSAHFIGYAGDPLYSLVFSKEDLKLLDIITELEQRLKENPKTFTTGDSMSLLRCREAARNCAKHGFYEFELKIVDLPGH